MNPHFNDADDDFWENCKMARWARPTDKPSDRNVNDLVHDFIDLDPQMWAVIDTAHFQRLRHLKQLGTTSFVWPCATHDRFVHSLGVAHLARRLVLHLKDNQPELKLTQRDVLCVELAGLCHDLGHGPFSHVFDGRFIPLVRKAGRLQRLGTDSWSHEHASVMMFDDMLIQNNLEIDEKDRKFVKALIDGKVADCPDEKPFLFEIVANKRNGIDVDKFDYIARDTRMFGNSTDFQIKKITTSCRVIDDEICFDAKIAHALGELCHKRYYLHQSHYNHKTATAVEHMLCDVLSLADEEFEISEGIDNPERYQYLKDSVLDQIAASKSKHPKLVEARKIIHRINTRDFYKCVDYNYRDFDDYDLCEEFITPERILEATQHLHRAETEPGTPTMHSSDHDPEQVDEADDSIDEADAKDLTADDIAVDIALLHHGMKAKNPLEFIQFYSKSAPTVAIPAPAGSTTVLQLNKYAEVLVRVYTKDNRYFHLIQAGYQHVMSQMAEKKAKCKESGVPLSPPATEVPATPRRTTPSLSQEHPDVKYTPNPFTRNPDENNVTPKSRRKKRSGRVRQEDSSESLAASPAIKNPLEEVDSFSSEHGLGLVMSPQLLFDSLTSGTSARRAEEAPSSLVAGSLRSAPDILPHGGSSQTSLPYTSASSNLSENIIARRDETPPRSAVKSASDTQGEGSGDNFSFSDSSTLDNSSSDSITPTKHKRIREDDAGTSIAPSQGSVKRQKI